MRLTHLSTTGLKGADLEVEIPPLLLLLGPNGSNKTAALMALHMLVFGVAPGQPATSDGLMRVMRGSMMEIRATFEPGSGDPETLSRRWTQHRKVDGKTGEVTTSLKESMEGTLLGEAKGVQRQAGVVLHRLGGWAHAWSPRSVIEGTPGELRTRLVRLLGRRMAEAGLERTPEDLRDCIPVHGESVDEWLRRAIASAKTSVEAAHSIASTIALQLSSGLDLAAPPKETEAQLAKRDVALVAEREIASTAKRLEREIARRRKELQG